MYVYRLIELSIFTSIYVNIQIYKCQSSVGSATRKTRLTSKLDGYLSGSGAAG